MSIGENLGQVYSSIKQAAVEGGHPSDKARLIAVSKTRPVEDIEMALGAGQRLFGENRVQEAQTKFPALKAVYEDLELHLIGPLQSNKARDAVALFDVIQTVDRPKIAHALAKEIKQQGRAVKLFIQVNVGEEPQKAGIAPHELGEFVNLCRETCQLEIAGLMCIPPVDEEPSPFFVLLGQLAKAHNIERLSMGMSADFETAVQFGADYVRVGTAIFGERT